MKSYLDLLETVLTKGRRREAPRNGAATLAVFGEQLRFDLSDGFPLVTTRKVPVRGAIEELLWFLSGSTNNEELVAKNVHIWDEWAVPEDVAEIVHLSHKARQALFINELKQKHADCYFDHMPAGWPDDAALAAAGVPTVTTTSLVKKGELGPIYGRSWRSWPNPDGTTTDQIKILVDNLKTRAYSRRHVVVAWNPSCLPDETMSPIDNVKHGRQCLAACHTAFQFSVEPLTQPERYTYLHNLPAGEIIRRFSERPAGFLGNANLADQYLDQLQIPRDRLSCKLFARSQDIPIGTTFNIASYAALTLMLCAQLNFAPGEYIHSMGDAHIYENQIEQVKEQLKRAPRPLPKLHIRPDVKSLFDYQYSDFALQDYDPHPKLDYPVTV